MDKKANKKFSSLYESYKTAIEIAGDKKGSYQLSLLLFILAFTFQGLAYAFFYPLIDSIFTNGFNLDESLFWLLLVAICTLISIIFRWNAHTFDFDGDIILITHNLRTKLGEKIKQIPLEKLYKYRTGELSSVLAEKVDESVMFMGAIAGMFLEIIVVSFVVIFTTFLIDWRMGLVLICVIPILVPIYYWKRKTAHKDKDDTAKIHSTLEADIIEYLQGLHVLRSINKVGENAKTLQSSIKQTRVLQKKGAIKAILPLLSMTTIIEFVFLLLLILGVSWAIDYETSVASVLALMIILARLLEPLSIFLGLTSLLDIMDSAFRKIKTLLDIQNLQASTPIQTPKAYNIEFENVSFSYLGYENKSLKNLSFTIKEKSLTAIVGESGSGKTTITKLIMRYADPQTGSVKIGSVDIKNIKTNKLMENISVVFQDVYLFDDTIFNNIQMGNPDATKDEVLLAAKRAYCDEFVSRLEKGYETKVGEIGGSLSGGERQRISIARAILKNSPIVILDEPTSSLDTKSEVAVQKALDSLIEDKTVIVIAHRLSTIAHADNILVVKEGDIIEKGTHKELVEKKGKYFNMFEAQNRVKTWSMIES